MEKMEYTKNHIEILTEYLGEIKITNKNWVQLQALATFTKIHADIVEALCTIQNTLTNINNTLKEK